MHTKAFVRLAVLIGVVLLISTGISFGAGSVTGSTAGSASQNQNENLESCERPLGTLALFEDQSLVWWNEYRQRYPHLGTTIPVIRMMVQQSNCFVVVERGGAMQAMQRERELMQSGNLRSNSNIGNGQMVAADYTLSPSVDFRKSKLGDVKGVARKLTGRFLKGLGQAAVGVDSSEASTTLLLLDNRSGVQISAAVGSAKKYGFSIFGSNWDRFGGGSVSTYANTDEGKVIMAAFADSYNQMVMALRNYKPQVVEGGLGAGGALAVDGAVQAVSYSEPAPAVVAPQPPVAPPQPVPVVRRNDNVSVNRSRELNANVDAYDEDALEDYYDALKAAVEHLGTFSSFTEPQISALKEQTKDAFFGLLWMPAFSSRMETSKIELESWPLSARQDGWAILGKKIKKYNELFFKYRDRIIENNGYDQGTKDRLSEIELVTEESLFAD